MPCAGGSAGPPAAGSQVVAFLVLIRLVVRCGVGRCKAAGDVLQGRRLRGETAMNVRMQRRAAVSRTIDHVDLVTFAHQVLKPPRASIRRAHPVETLTAAT